MEQDQSQLGSACSVESVEGQEAYQNEGKKQNQSHTSIGSRNSKKNTELVSKELPEEVEEEY